MYVNCIGIVVLCCLSSNYVTSKSTFDQRQTGDFNVQVDLKDINIVAFLKGGKQEYVDYDYAYDYSELTIKPQIGSTSKPSKVTNTPFIQYNNTTVSTTSPSAEQTTAINNNSISSSEAADVTTSPSSNESTTIKDNITTAKVELDKVNGTLVLTSSNDTDCKIGLNKGDNALVQLVNMSQKLKIRKKN